MFAIYIVSLLNIFCISTFFFLRWGPDLYNRIHIVEKILAITFVVFIIILGFFSKTDKYRRIVLLLNFNILFFILLIVVLEIVFSLFPSLLPKPLLDFAPQLNPATAAKRLEILDYLNESPWVKFKANTDIDTRPITYRGDDFTYSWKTDGLGFKNNPDLIRSEKMSALAIGDSSVEAMGVAVDKTWETLISDKDYKTYNLGVQGYAPQQMIGALEKYGVQYKVDYIIYGYTIGFEGRTLNFENNSKNPVLTGAVETVDKFTKKRRAETNKLFGVTNATIDFWESLFSSGLVVNISDRTNEEHLAFYINEINREDDIFDQSGQSWKLTLQSILDAKRIATEKNAKLVILIFPNRDSVYAEKLTGRSLVNNDTKLVAALKEFAKQHNLDVIDLYPALKSYTGNLPEPIDVAALPYFKIDGHLNEIGQKIVADEVINYLDSQK